MKGGKNLVQGLEEIIMDDNLFLIKGIKEFIKDYEKDNKKIYLNENMHIKKLYEDKRKVYAKNIVWQEFPITQYVQQNFLHIIYTYAGTYRETECQPNN